MDYFTVPVWLWMRRDNQSFIQSIKQSLIQSNQTSCSLPDSPVQCNRRSCLWDLRDHYLRELACVCMCVSIRFLDSTKLSQVSFGKAHASKRSNQAGLNWIKGWKHHQKVWVKWVSPWQTHSDCRLHVSSSSSRVATRDRQRVLSTHLYDS